MILVFARTWMRRKPRLWILVGLGVFFGILPDLIGAYGNIVERDHWTLYRNAHFGAIKNILQYIPMYSLHLHLDALMHGPGHRWWRWDERLWLEVLLWVINTIVLVWIISSWRRSVGNLAGQRTGMST